MQYNVSTAKIIVASFFAFCCTGKTCITSFITVFLKHMGFTPFQAGMFRCLQLFVGGAAIVGISYCSKIFQKRISWGSFILISVLCYLVLLITSLQYPCFNTHHISCGHGEIIVPEYLQTVSTLDVTDNNPNTINNYGTVLVKTPSEDAINISTDFTGTTSALAKSDQEVKSTPLLNNKRTDLEHGTNSTKVNLINTSSYPLIRREYSYPSVPITRITLPESNMKTLNSNSNEKKPAIYAEKEFANINLLNTDNYPNFSLTKDGRNMHTGQSSVQEVINFKANSYNQKFNKLPASYLGKSHRPRHYVFRRAFFKVPSQNFTSSFQNLYINQHQQQFLKIWKQQPYKTKDNYQNSVETFRKGHLHGSKEYVLRHKRTYPEDENDSSRTISSRNKKSSSVILFNNTAYSTKLKTATVTKLWPSVNLTCLFVVLGLLLLGEFTSCPISKIADESWYQYLDEIDYTERYDQRMCGVSVTTTITLISIAVIVKMFCTSEFFVLPPYHLHIYTFILFWAIIFFLGYFFPEPMDGTTQSYVLFKGMAFMRHMCYSGRAAAVLITVIVCGALQGCINDFLLWYMEEMDASEFVTTCAVVIAFVSELLPQCFSKYITKRASSSCMLSIAMFSYSVRFGLIAALWIPWALASTQVLQCVSNYFFWLGIQNYVIQICYQGTSRSAMLLLNLIYYCLGHLLGSILGGLVYSLITPQILFGCMGGISLLWGILFFLLQYCSLETQQAGLPKSMSSIYRDNDDPQSTSLLGVEDDEIDDWLDKAIKLDNHEQKQSRL